MMDLTLSSWTLAILPVLVLLAGILWFKWEAAQVGAVSWFIALVVASTYFGADWRLLSLANSKGMSLSLFVLLIIWGAVLLYNVVEKSGAIKVIGAKMVTVTEDKLLQCLLLSWCFTSLLQGIAGFGVPVAVVAPIMVVMGFSPLTAVATCLIGHSWAISFGSMGSSYYSIQLVTKIPGEVIGPLMALTFAIPIFATGFGVAHIYGGMAAVRKGMSTIIPTGAAMSATLWFMNFIGAAQLASLMAAISGCCVMMAIVLFRRQRANAPTSTPDPLKKPGMGFHLACAPYYALILISITLQIKFIKSALAAFAWGLDYPAVQTSLGYMVKAEKMYSKINFFSHPAPILLVASLFGYWVYTRRLGPLPGLLSAAVRDTIAKCLPTSIGIATMVMMALIMNDTGMTLLLAKGVAQAFGGFFPLVSPFVGVLGSFITGSNTNSNIMFGALQFETATVLGKSGALMAAVQSVGGSLGVSMAPSTILIGATNVGMSGRENEIMATTIKYCLFNTSLVGIAAYLAGLYFQ